jgi:coenzyme F420 hydrogenase subunit beta
MSTVSGKGMILPEVDKTTCSSCGLCEKVCPILNLEGPKDQFESISTGVYYAVDRTIFDASSSGGATGGILQYLFEHDRIDCAIVTGISGIHAVATVIRDVDEISAIQGSKYQPVALNAALRMLEKGDRFALVGLPCHINGLRRLARYNRTLEEGLVVAIGIYCTIGRSMFSTLAALNDIKETRGDLCYRYGDYPGNFGFVQDKKFIQLSTVQHFLEQFDFLFYPRGCHYCDDLYNVHADISIGDTWGLGCGKSAIVMARTEIGEETVTNSRISGMLHKLRDASREENHATQAHSYRYKIYNYYHRMKTISPFTGQPIQDVLPVADGKAAFLAPYLLLYVFCLLLNTSIGYRAVTYRFCRKLLLKIRNRLLKVVA